MCKVNMLKLTSYSPQVALPDFEKSTVTCFISNVNLSKHCLVLTPECHEASKCYSSWVIKQIRGSGISTALLQSPVSTSLVT